MIHNVYVYVYVVVSMLVVSVYTLCIYIFHFAIINNLIYKNEKHIIPIKVLSFYVFP